MRTLLLISGERGADSPEPGRPVQRGGPSMRRTLQRVGYEVVEVGNAAGAFARLGDRPDLIVVSSAVPDMDLLDLCTGLRNHPVAEKIPFVLVADAAAQIGIAATRSGADLVFPASVGDPLPSTSHLRRGVVSPRARPVARGLRLVA